MVILKRSCPVLPSYPKQELFITESLYKTYYYYISIIIELIYIMKYTIKKIILF